MNPEKIADQFRHNLKRIRTTLGVSQTELGRRLHTTPGFICDFEKGRRIPSIVTLAKLAEGLGVSPAALISSHDGPIDSETLEPTRRARKSATL